MNFSRCLAALAVIALAGCALPGTTQGVPTQLQSHGVGTDLVARTLVYAGGPGLNEVDGYPAGADNPKPVRRIVNSLSAPTGVAVDSSGNVYVCNNSGFGIGPKGKSNYWTLTVYHRGKAKPFEAYTDGEDVDGVVGIIAPIDQRWFVPSEVRRDPSRVRICRVRRV